MNIFLFVKLTKSTKHWYKVGYFVSFVAVLFFERKMDHSVDFRCICLNPVQK